MRLTEFLLARISEDETVARAALEPVRNGHTGEDIGFGTEWEWYVDKVDQEWGEADHPGEQHVARFDPARMLAECEAKRSIVSFASRLIRDDLDSEPWAGEEVLVRLAAIYADHPDYDPDWAL